MPRLGRGWPVSLQRLNKTAAAPAAAPTGTIAAALQKLAASLTGAQTQTGTAAATLRPVAASLTGAVQQSGALAATLKPVAAALTALSKMEALVSDFDAGIDAGLWVKSGGNTAEITASGGAVRIDHIVSEYNFLSSVSPYDLTGSYLYAKFADFGDQGVSGHRSTLGVWIDGSNRIDVLVGENIIDVAYFAGSGTDLGAITLDTTAHRWCRIRESNGTIYVDTAPDGSTWTNRWSVANPWPVTAMYAYLWAGGGGADYGVFDNVNTTPSITGAVAATLQPAAASLTGAMQPAGTASATLVPAAANLTGVMQPQGSIAATLQKITAALTGTQTQTGAATATLQKVTASFTGVMQPSGTVSAALVPAAANLTGSQSYSGTAAATLVPAAAILTGAMQPIGIAAATMQKVSAAATGAQTQTGIVAATLVTVAAAITGAMQPSGIAAATLKPLTADLTGSLGSGPTGTVTATLVAAASSLTGAETQTGTVAASLVQVSASLTGLMQPRGTLSASLVPIATALTGAQTQTGTAAATLVTVAASLTGAMQPKGTASATLVPGTASLSGTQNLHRNRHGVTGAYGGITHRCGATIRDDIRRTGDSGGRGYRRANLHRRNGRRPTARHSQPDRRHAAVWNG